LFVWQIVTRIVPRCLWRV